MESLWELLKSVIISPIFSLASFVIAILAIMFSYFFYRKTKKDKRPVYAMRSSNIVRDFSRKLPNLKIVFDGNTIESLTVTKFALWNEGRETISKTDIAQSDPIRLVLKNNDRILDVSVLYSTKVANAFTAEKYLNNDWVCVGFDYLDDGDGAVVQIIHTGYETSSIECQGTIKGVRSIARHASPRSRLSQTLSLLSLGTIAFVYLFLIRYYELGGEYIMIAYAIFFLMFIRRIYKDRLPKRYNVFYEEM